MTHKNSRQWRSCETKVRYPNEKAAQKRARIVRKWILRPYFCKFCRKWHVGHRPKNH